MWPRRRIGTAAIPSAETAPLSRAFRRARVLRVVLALALVGLLAALVAVARGRDVGKAGFAPPGTSAVVVLDLSASISGAIHRRVGAVLARLAAKDEPVGLVGFSDVAYELLPPGSPGRELRPLVRFFRPAGGPRSPTATPAPNPWAAEFRAGTHISAGLRAAHEAIERDGIDNASVLLVSDLDMPSSDLPAVRQAIAALQRDSVELRIVPLFPFPDDRAFFERLVGRDAFVEEGLPTFQSAGADPARTAPPWLFVVIALVMTFVLAANERLCGRLSVPRVAEERP